MWLVQLIKRIQHKTENTIAFEREKLNSKHEIYEHVKVFWRVNVHFF